MRPGPNLHVESSVHRIHRLLAKACLGGIAAVLFVGSTPASGAQDEDGATLPGIEAVEALGTLVGEWSMAGLAGNAPEGDAGGRMFQARQSVQWIEPGRSLGVVWSVMLEDGSIITSGRGRINWDDIAGAVVNTYRGEENGRPFTGSATLIEAGGGIFDWRGHETSGASESVNFEVTYAFPSEDLCKVDFIPTCVDGEVELDPAQFSWKRVNPFHEAMPFAPDLVGEWILRSGGSDSLPDGTRMEVRPGRGDRSLSFLMIDPGTEGDFLASAILWLDESTSTLGLHQVMSDGAMLNGSPSIERRDGRRAIRVAWKDGSVAPDGAGETPYRLSWTVLDGDRLTVEDEMIGPDGRPMPDETVPARIWERSGD